MHEEERPGTPPVAFAASCDVCRRPTSACVCDRVASYPTQRRILILQHPREQDALLGSAQILVACLPKAKVSVGLSWRSLAHALDEDGVDVSEWAVLFPNPKSPHNRVTGRGDALIDPKLLKGLVVLDGTWSQAKTLWWRNPWLVRLNRMNLKPERPSIYGKLRAEPKSECLSTLESAAAALTLCGEPAEIEVGLLRVFRTLVQRVRDAHLVPAARAGVRRGQGSRLRRPRPPKR
jgi:DTW domain-containing protein